MVSTLPYYLRHDVSIENSFLGSWAGGPWSSRTTVIPTLFTMISDDENKHEVSLEGVGSDGLVINILLGGK